MITIPQAYILTQFFKLSSVYLHFNSTDLWMLTFYKKKCTTFILWICYNILPYFTFSITFFVNFLLSHWVFFLNLFCFLTHNLFTRWPLKPFVQQRLFLWNPQNDKQFLIDESSRVASCRCESSTYQIKVQYIYANAYNLCLYIYNYHNDIQKCG